MESKNLPETGYEFLVEKEAMWAEMLIQVLKEKGIPYTALPVYGAGLVIKAGMKERMRIFVAAEKKPQAEEILEELFSNSENQ